MTAAQLLVVMVAVATVAALLLGTIALQIANDRPDMFLPAGSDRPVVVWSEPPAPVVLIGRPPAGRPVRPMWMVAA